MYCRAGSFKLWLCQSLIEGLAEGFCSVANLALCLPDSASIACISTELPYVMEWQPSCASIWSWYTPKDRCTDASSLFSLAVTLHGRDCRYTQPEPVRPVAVQDAVPLHMELSRLTGAFCHPSTCLLVPAPWHSCLWGLSVCCHLPANRCWYKWRTILFRISLSKCQLLEECLQSFQKAWQTRRRQVRQFDVL